MQIFNDFPKQTFIIMLTTLRAAAVWLMYDGWLCFEMWVGWASIQAAG